MNYVSEQKKKSNTNDTPKFRKSGTVTTKNQ